MLAALDETYPELAGGIAYVVAATVLVADEDETRAMLAEVLDAHGRTRPFHWHSEGPLARSRMLQCLEGLGAIAGAFAYGWRGKHEPVTWLAADAVCGAVREHLIDPGHAQSFDRLREAAALSDLIYVAGGGSGHTTA